MNRQIVSGAVVVIAFVVMVVAFVTGPNVTVMKLAAFGIVVFGVAMLLTDVVKAVIRAARVRDGAPPTVADESGSPAAEQDDARAE